MIKSINLMKCCEVAGISLIVAEMVKASGVVGAQHIRDFERISSRGYHQLQEGPCRMGGEYRRLLLQGLCVALQPQIARPGHEGSREGGRELPMTTNAHQSHAVWLQAWCSTTDAIFIVRHPQEKVYAINKTLYMAYWSGRDTHVSSGGIFASLVSRSGWCASYSACMIVPEEECVLVAICVECSVWKYEFNKALDWAPCCSSRFWKPFTMRFIQDVPRKTHHFSSYCTYFIPHYCQ